jgi:uncharacterized membrane protein
MGILKKTQRSLEGKKTYAVSFAAIVTPIAAFILKHFGVEIPEDIVTQVIASLVALALVFMRSSLNGEAVK